jgi:hypothetical protein
LVDVTIGLAVYNGASTLAAAIDSLLTQTHSAIRLVIADNGSTDETQAICVHYERFGETIPVMENYRRLLLNADTPYFMWAAADDLWAPTFVATHRAVLIDWPDYVMSQSQVLFVSDGQPSRMAIGTFPLTDAYDANLARFLAQPADNSRFYGLFRTKALQKSYPENEDFPALDWAVSAHTLRFGKHHETSQILMVRDETHATRYATTAAKTAGGVSRILPLWDFSRHMLSTEGAPRTPAALARLTALNVKIALRFASYKLADVAQNAASPSSNRGWISRTIAASVARVLDVGLSERWQLAKVSARKMVGLHPSKAVPALKAFGWRAPATKQGAPNSSALGVVIVACNQLQAVLTAIDHLAASTIDVADIVIVDNVSTDATGLVFRARRDLTYVPLQNKQQIGSAISTGVAATSAGRIVVVHGGKLMHEGCIEDIPDGLARLSTRADEPGRPAYAVDRLRLQSVDDLSRLETLEAVHAWLREPTGGNT